MLFFDLPLTRDRYVAEVRNFLCVRCRPLCIVGAPRASLRELRVELGGERLSRNSFRVGGSVVVVHKHCTIVYKLSV